MAAGLERIAEDFPGSLTTVERERERDHSGTRFIGSPAIKRVPSFSLAVFVAGCLIVPGQVFYGSIVKKNSTKCYQGLLISERVEPRPWAHLGSKDSVFFSMGLG